MEEDIYKINLKNSKVHNKTNAKAKVVLNSCYLTILKIYLEDYLTPHTFVSSLYQDLLTLENEFYLIPALWFEEDHKNYLKNNLTFKKTNSFEHLSSRPANVRKQVLFNSCYFLLSWSGGWVGRLGGWLGWNEIKALT